MEKSNLTNKEPCPHCGRYANRGISIDAIIINDKDEFLLIKRGAEPFRGYWGLVGGYIEWDESAEDAVKREVSEEIGMQVTEIIFVGAYTKPERHPRRVIDLAYTVKTTGEPKAGDDAAEFQWVHIDDLPEELAFDHRQIIDDYLRLTKR